MNENRLTLRTPNGIALAKEVDIVIDLSEFDKLQTILYRLAAYEDLGTPAELAELVKAKSGRSGSS